MSRYSSIVRLVRRVLGLPPVVEDLFEITVKVLDPEPRVKGQPLSYRDVERQRQQAASAARAFPSSTPAPDTPTQPAVPRQMPGRKRS